MSKKTYYKKWKPNAHIDLGIDIGRVLKRYRLLRTTKRKHKKLEFQEFI